jgi:hypothetical protein
VAPEAAFDVTCAGVEAVVNGLIGEPAGVTQPTLGLTSSPNWYPGPAQHMMQRAGGIACSAGDGERRESTPGPHWEVVLLPNAPALIDGAVRRGAGEFAEGDLVTCDGGGCRFVLRDGEVLLSGSITVPVFSEADGPRVDQALRPLLAQALRSLREVDRAPSEIMDIACERLLTAQELSDTLGTPLQIIDSSELGGWGIAAEVYVVSEGATYCMYAEGPDLYQDPTRLIITTLPGGAWAFESLEDGTPVVVEGADAALAGTDYYGSSVLDVRVGLDWIRFTTYDGGGTDLVSIATMAVEHFTQGRPAPQ